MNSNRLVIGLSIAAVLIGLGLVFFAFGTPMAPEDNQAGVASSPGAAPASSTSSAKDGAVDSSGATEGVSDAADPDSADDGSSNTEASGVGEVISEEVPEADPNSPLAIQIPGCVCHSDDPDLVEEHAQYRMNQCFGCHAGG